MHVILMLKFRPTHLRNTAYPLHNVRDIHLPRRTPTAVADDVKLFYHPQLIFRVPCARGPARGPFAAAAVATPAGTVASVRNRALALVL